MPSVSSAHVAAPEVQARGRYHLSSSRCIVPRRIGLRGTISKETAVNLSYLTTLSTLSLSFSFFPFLPYNNGNMSSDLYMSSLTAIIMPRRTLCLDISSENKVCIVYYVT
ncbi:hypothetical protein ACS0PU_011021 [Formica fusca]